MARVTSRQSETVEHHFDTFTAMDIVVWPECRDLGTEADHSPSLSWDRAARYPEQSWPGHYQKLSIYYIFRRENYTRRKVFSLNSRCDAHPTADKRQR